MRRILTRPTEGSVSHSLLVAFVLAATTTGAVAATFTVDRTDDDPNAIQCTPAPIDCSLRGAVRRANITPGAPHTIVLQNGDYDLSVVGPNEDAALTGDLDIDVDLIVQGAGPDTTHIQMPPGAPPNERDRIFHITSADVEFHGVSINAGTNVDNGGAIYALSSNITLNNSRTYVNIAQERGGGVYCLGGSLTVMDSEIINGLVMFNEGGGIYARSCPVTVSSSVFRSNFAGGPGDPGRGAAIYFDGNDGQDSLEITDTIMNQNFASLSGGALFITDGTAQITGSTFRDNWASDPGGKECGESAIGTGGGITVDLDAAVTLTDTTLLGNCADEFGGGAQVLGSLTLDSSTVRCNIAPIASGGLGLTDGSVATITNSTISQNSSAVGAGINAVLADLTLTNSTIADQLGDGLAMVTTFGTVQVTNTVFGDTCAQLPSSTIVSGGGNVEPLGQTCVDAPLGTDQSVADVGLGPLGDFGGPTQTHLPLPGSPVLGAAVEGSCPATDQRGLPRPDCDSGSVERQTADPEPIFFNDFECMGTDLWSSVSP